MDFADELIHGKQPESKKEESKKGPVMNTREELFEEMMGQQTYTDIVELVLKFLKSQKGTPADLVILFEYFNKRLVDSCTTIDESKYQFELQQVSGEFSPASNKQGSKLAKLILGMRNGEQVLMLVEFHLKMLHSVHKNKKAPAYMLKSILISLDKLKFDR